jgi:hypothetical protein
LSWLAVAVVRVLLAGQQVVLVVARVATENQH